VDVCLSALLNPGDNLLTPSPDYPLYSAVLGKTGDRTEHLRPERRRWLAARLDRRPQKDRPRAGGIVLIKPQQSDWRRVLAAHAGGDRGTCPAKQSRHLADEIYDNSSSTMTSNLDASVAPDVPVVTFGGLSKNYLDRDGASAGDRQWAMGRGQALHRRNPSTAAALACAQIIPNSMRSKPHWRASRPSHRGQGKLRSRRDLTIKWCEATPRVSCVSPARRVLRLSAFGHPLRTMTCL